MARDERDALTVANRQRKVANPTPRMASMAELENLSQPSAWSDRVGLVMDAVGYNIRAESSWVKCADAALLLKPRGPISEADIPH
jgi:hypothetical protein